MKTEKTFHSIGILIGLGIGVGVGLACSSSFPGHCGNQNGDYSCVDQGGGYCDLCRAEANGCTLDVPTENCYFPGDPPEMSSSGMEASGTTSNEPAATTIELSTSGVDETGGTSHGEVTTIGVVTASESSTGFDTTVGEGPCVDDSDCMDTAVPFCLAGTCVDCSVVNAEGGGMSGDDACAGLDALTPICTDGACLPCSEHSQCGPAACNFYTGSCLPSDAVVHVGPGRSADFNSITAAANSFMPGQEGTIIVHQDNYGAHLDVSDGRVLAFLAHNSSTPVWTNPFEGYFVSPQLSVTDGTVLIEGIQLSGNHVLTEPAVQVGNSGKVWLDRSRVISNAGGAVLTQGPFTQLTLRNCFADSGADGTDAIRAENASIEISYSTLIGRYGQSLGGGLFTGGRALSCDMSSGQVTDSILLRLGSQLDPVSCGGIGFGFSASEQALPGVNNIDVGPFDNSKDWFADVDAGDFALSNSGETIFADIAEWNSGDPAEDIDNESRNKLEGEPDFAGADVP